MRSIDSFKYFLFLIIMSVTLSANLYSQKNRTVRNPERNNMGDRHDQPGSHDTLIKEDNKRKEHTGTTIERPERQAPAPIEPKRKDPPAENPPAYNPPPYAPPYYDPPVYYPPLKPDPEVIIIEPIYRPEESPKHEEPYDPIKKGLTELDDLDYKGALKDFNFAIDKDTSNYKLYYYRGLALTGLTYYNESIKDFNIYLKYFFYDEEGYFQRGLAKFYLGEKTKALVDFQTAADMGHKKAAFIIKKFYD